MTVKKHMKHLWMLIVPMLAAPAVSASGVSKQDPMCAPLRTFARSVQAGQKRTIEFHTVWGGDFKSMTAPSIYAIQCTDNGYQPAMAVCKVLVHHGAIEFSDINAMRAVSCLSPGTRFANRISMSRLELSLDYGSENRGSTVTVSYGPASQMRGMAMVITAEGY